MSAPDSTPFTVQKRYCPSLPPGDMLMDDMLQVVMRQKLPISSTTMDTVCGIVDCYLCLDRVHSLLILLYKGLSDDPGPKGSIV